MNIISAEEQFQNDVLRPILKSQNELLIAIFRTYIKKRKVAFDNYEKTDKLAYIEQVIKKDQPLRNLFLGTIIGHFSIEQYENYQPFEDELSRRTITMIIKRLQSQLA
jgi:hypothetical protein